MASIYKATDRRLDRFVAVKIMHPHLANDEEFVTRFIREAKAIASLSHPNIVSIQDQGWNEGGAPAVFIVMEYVDGFTLRDLLYERGYLAPRELLHYLTPVVSALAQAHNLGIIHRDMKPENILLAKDGRIKVADFGLARGSSLGSTMTIDSSVILGSVSYLSPEQVERGIADARSDIYSLGIMCFELLTGKKPFEGDTPIQIAFKHVNDRVPTPSLSRSGIPPSFDALVLKATARNPDQRHRDGAELLEDFTRIHNGLDPKPPQLVLDLDLPPRSPALKPKRARPEVRVGNTLVTKVRSFTEPHSIKPDATKANFIPEGKLEVPTLSNSGAVRRKTSKRVRRNRYIAALLFLLLLIGGLYELAGRASGVSLPSVVGMNVKDAERTLSSLGMHVLIAQREFDQNVPAGAVISSAPGGGARLNRGGAVGLTISNGVATVPSPVITPSAIATPHGTKAAGTITVKSYVGLTSDQAQSELTADGLSVNQAFAYSESVAIGNVISQTPDGGAQVAPGSNITIVVSQGSAHVNIPNVISYSGSYATTQLENLQLKVVERKIGSGKHVVSISPTVGTQVERGSTVVITLR